MRQATVMMTDSSTEVLKSCSLTDESGNLHLHFPEKMRGAQLFTTSAACSWYTTVSVWISNCAFYSAFGIPANSPANRGNSINTWLAVHVTQIHTPGCPGANDLHHLKNWVAFYRSLGRFKSRWFVPTLQTNSAEELNIEWTIIINNELKKS